MFCLLAVFLFVWGRVYQQIAHCCWYKAAAKSLSSFTKVEGIRVGHGCKQPLGGSKSSQKKHWRGSPVLAFWMTFLCLWRVGEANNPGPSNSPLWTLGTFNPSGVTSKADVVGQLDGDFWGICETHLSDIGRRRFVHALRCQQSKWQYFIPGAPCPLRARSEEVGSFSGVAGLSSWPTRALTHSLHDGWYQSSRVQVLGTFIQQLWMSVAVVYGFPNSKTHHTPRFQTEQLLEGAIDRIACQTQGPRVIMGDFNWEQHELTQLAWEWWGVPIKPTGKGDRRIDYVYVSPELFPALRRVEVDNAQWLDHSAVIGIFQGWQPVVERFHWKMPLEGEWPEQMSSVEYPVHPNPTVAYAMFWAQLEQAASRAQFQASGKSWHATQFGRGKTLDTVVSRYQHAPIRKARWGEENPSFNGCSIRYSQQFKQVRRLQALVAQQRKGNSSGGELGQLWSAIRNSTGFQGGFCVWWRLECFPKHGGPPTLTMCIPCHEDCKSIFQAVKSEVQLFAKQLSKQRYMRAKDIRASNLRYVYKDCAREPPRKVDVLIESVEAEVQADSGESQWVELTTKVPFSLGKEGVVNGVPVCILAQHEQHVQLSPTKVQAGDILRQTTVTAEIPAIFEAFKQEWEPRWNRHSKVCVSQWDQICQFAKAHLQPISWNFPGWSEDSFVQVLRSKKSTAATGPDGVTRKDLMSLPSHAIRSLLQVYSQAEQHAKWPLQLTNGIVSSLEKTPEAQSVKQYRPVVVYPLVYRVWSSARARQFLKALAMVTPPGLRGGLPSCQSKSIWFEVAMELEEDHAGVPTLIGLVADLQKAFNTIPRVPLWQCLMSLGCPDWLIRSWAAFTNQQVRRFKVRNSIGPGIQSDCGYPEGCGLSVCAMAVLDLLLDFWMVAQFPTLRVLTYVDDWQFIHRSITQQQAVEARVLSFVSCLDMNLDHRKTFTWSTNAAFRHQLQQGQFQVVHHAKSLGVHANFTKQLGNRTLVDRIKSLQGTWRLLRRSVAPYSSKIASLRVLAWPRALYGIGVTSIAPLHFANLRTGAAFGLRSNRVGAHPALRLAQHGFSFDPEGWAIWSTIKDFRDFANAAYVEATLSRVGSGDVRLPTNGPIAVLAARVSRLGWSSPMGRFVDEIGEFSLFNSHLDALKIRVSIAWPRVVAGEVAHRKSFSGFQKVDLGETARILKQFPDPDRVYLQCALDGTMYTNQGKQHRKHSGADAQLCPFCKCQDGFYHRLWECPQFSDLRTSLAASILSEVQGLPKCQSCHGWAVKAQSHLDFLSYLDAIQPYDANQYRLDLCRGSQIDLFVDGSCHASDEPTLRFASWAVTTAH